MWVNEIYQEMNEIIALVSGLSTFETIYYNMEFVSKRHFCYAGWLIDVETSAIAVEKWPSLSGKHVRAMYTPLYPTFI